MGALKEKEERWARLQMTAPAFGGAALRAPAAPGRSVRAARCTRSPHRRRPRACAGRPPNGAPERLPERAPDAAGSKYAHLPADERAEMLALDALAEEWIGGSIARWEWYERLKARRERLRARVKRQEESLSGQMDDLRGVLMQLDALFGLGLVESDTERVSVLGWVTVLAVSVANFVVAYALLELASNAVFAAFPPSPF